MKKLGIYIHIPFCLRKCPYCDFYSIPFSEGGESQREEYLNCLKKEMAFYGDKLRKDEATSAPLVDTVFFGGGTPSLLTGEEMKSLLDCLKRNFDFQQDAEITVECNPATVDFHKLTEYREAGVNRISIGVQSFDNDILRRLGRVHSKKKAFETIETVKAAGFDNFSIDLMFAIPGQTFESWEKTVREALEQKPAHISLYSLEFMEGTPFFAMRDRGELRETGQEEDRAMYERALDLMEADGYHQYEISNVAYGRERESRHNMKYWTMEAYLGLGASAHSYLEGLRLENQADIAAYTEAVEKTGCGVKSQSKSDEEEAAAIYMFTGLRTGRGIELADFKARFGKELWEYFGASCKEEFERFALEGFAEKTAETIRLTRKGMSISNRIMCLFV